MTPEWVSAFLSGVAIVISIVAAFKAHNISKLEALATQGSLELQIRSSINEAYYNITRFGMLVSEKPEDELCAQAYLGAEEVYRNVYEDACDKYLRNKVDKEGFKRMYMIEIRRLVEDEPHKEYYSSNQSPYINTLAVYKEWYRS